jgi:antitoxin component YwqK of YwqJK toxin-antitoxin module
MKRDIVNRNDKGQLHGEQIVYHDNYPCQIWYKQNYINGNKHGEQIGYYNDGQIMYTNNYINGNKYGEHIGYDDNGEIMYKLNYINGVYVSQEEWIAYDRKLKMKMISNL